MRFGKPHRKQLISLVLLGVFLLPWVDALAGDEFGANWQPKPLVDPNASVPAKVQLPGAPAQTAVQPVQPDLEAKLKPVEPFVKEIENRLTIATKPGTTMVYRLNNIQAVLFGTQKYQDAGQLITKLTEVFPEEAKKAQAEMDRQFQSTMQANAAASNPASTGNVANKGKAAQGKNAPAMAQPYAPNQVASTAAPVQAAPKKKKHSFWGTDDFDSDFDNDPFFQNSFQGRVKTNAVQSAMPGGMTSQSMSSTQSGFSQQMPQQQVVQQPYGAQTTMQQSNGPSRLASVAQGLAGLALVVGGLAGTYYMNKGHMAGNAYGSPYGNPYGNPYGSPYGYSPYGNGMSSYGTGMSPYGMGMTPYGNGIPLSSYGSGMMPQVRSMSSNVSPYVAPSFGANSFGTNGQTYNYSPYGSSPGYSPFGSTSSTFSSGSSSTFGGLPGGSISPLGVPGF